MTLTLIIASSWFEIYCILARLSRALTPRSTSATRLPPAPPPRASWPPPASTPRPVPPPHNPFSSTPNLRSSPPHAQRKPFPRHPSSFPSTPQIPHSVRPAL